MAERTILVCDECGNPATETVTIKVGNRNLVKDLCSAHIAQIVRGARRPRPGRRPRMVGAEAAPAQPRRRGRPPKSVAAAAATTPRRRGRPRKVAS